MTLTQYKRLHPEVSFYPLLPRLDPERISGKHVTLKDCRIFHYTTPPRLLLMYEHKHDDYVTIIYDLADIEALTRVCIEFLAIFGNRLGPGEKDILLP